MVLLALLPAAAAGQVARRGVHGVVVDGSSGEPLSGATLTLEPLPSGVVASAEGGSPSFLSRGRQVATDAGGTYAFVGVGPGSYRLRVERIGYRARTLDVHYEGAADPRVSIGLELQPLELEPIRVVTGAPSRIRAGREVAGAEESGRLTLERLRQERYLTSDARVVTDQDMLEATTLGETDLLRALQRLPGVTGEDDWSAEPWTRGARWDETRIYFDGLPLFDPMHMGGAFASINPDAVGSLTFHPGVRPLDAGDGSAAVVDLRSRSATPGDGLTGLAQASVLSARFTLDRPFAGGGGITVSARRSYFDQLTRVASDGIDDFYVPYRFTDLTGRWDQVISDSVRLEVSGMTGRDLVLGDVPNELKGARGSWGNSLGRATLEVDRYGLRTRITTGGSTFQSDISTVAYDEARADLFEANTAAATFNEVSSQVTEITLAPRSRSGAQPGWQAGARWTTTRIEYRGPAPWPYPDAADAGELDRSSHTARASYWGRLNRSVGTELRLSAGVRLDAGDVGGPGYGAVVAPRVVAAWAPDDDLRVTAAFGRHMQYEQAIAAAGFTLGPALVPGHLWVGTAYGVPGLRSDIATLGVERWLGGGWLASATAFWRSTDGRLTPSPDSGYVRARPPVVERGRGDGWTTGSGRAIGLEAAARKLSGRWTGSVGYSLIRARTSAGRVTYSTPGERTHALDATFAFRLTSSTTLGGAATAATGAAYTRFYAFRCTAVTWYCAEVDTGPDPILGWVEPAGSERTPAYASLDLQIEHTGRVFGLPFGVYGQLRNALARDNRAAYVGSILDCDAQGRDCTLTDRFEDGFPRLPLLGFWLRL
jgi:hypothetical protein